MPEGRGAVLARLHEAVRRVALWRHAFVRLSWIRRFSRIRGSSGWHWIRVCDKPDGHDTHWRPPRCGAQKRALRRSPELMRACLTTLKAFIARHPVATYFALTFAISWGGVLLVIGKPSGTGVKAQDSPLFPFAVLAMLAGPSVTGLLLTGLLDGRPGLRE